MAIYKLDEALWFPDPHGGEEDGLIAVGGDLSVDRLLLAYCYGIFPWFSYSYHQEPYWYCPMQRFVIFPNEIHVSHSMRQLIRQHKYTVTFNQNFEGVIRGCSTVSERDQNEMAWLGPEMIAAYIELHRQNLAASVEVWETTADQGRRLVGGLYGVAIRYAFFGESMFSLVPNASKLALIALADLLAEKDFLFIDCQFETPHLRSMGGRYISYDEYMRILDSKDKL